jgi:hypothetical protein
VAVAVAVGRLLCVGAAVVAVVAAAVFAAAAVCVAVVAVAVVVAVLVVTAVVAVVVAVIAVAFVFCFEGGDVLFFVFLPCCFSSSVPSLFSAGLWLLSRFSPSGLDLLASGLSSWSPLLLPLLRRHRCPGRFLGEV